MTRRSILDLPDLTLATLCLAADDSNAHFVEPVVPTVSTARTCMNDDRTEGQIEASSSNGAYTSKTAPGVVFATRQELAEHNKSDWHRLNIKRLAAGLAVVSEDDFLRIVSDLEDGASISGSDSGISEEDEDGDEDEFRNIVEAQATLAVREKQRRLNRLAEGRGGEVEVGEDDSSVSRAGAIVAVSVEGLLGGGRGEAGLAGVERWGLYRQLFPKGWEEDEAKREDIGAALLSLKHGKITYFFASGGHFAGAVYQGHRCIAHKTFHRYVIRAKAGTRQATSDASGKVAKSAGSSLRRHNEAMLQQDIADLLKSWKAEIDESERIFVHAPGTINRNSIFIKDVLARNDLRVRAIPFNTRRPTNKEVERVHNELLALHALDLSPPATTTRQPKTKTAPTKGEGAATAGEAPGIKQAVVELESALFGYVTKANEPAIKLAVAEGADINEAEPRQGRTPLHRAALGGPARLVSFLLEMSADPTLSDFAGKVPYELCRDKESRDSFRRFWAAEPDKWDYRNAAIPSMLSSETAEEQERRVAEKKERERLRRKEQEKRKKENERARKEAEEAQRIAEEAEAHMSERERRALAAERRLGLETASNSPVFECAACKQHVQRTPFERMGHKYCSTSCVVSHKAVLGS